MRRTLLSTVAVPLSLVQRQRIERIDSENFAPIVRKVHEELARHGAVLSDEDADEAILALKQYYAVAVLDPANLHAVSDTIDPYWHAHILHTRQYETFCQDVVRQYMHHEPLDHADRREVQRVAGLYAYTVDVFGRMFSYVNEDFYPSGMPDIRMVCLHGDTFDEDLRRDTIFPVMAKAA